MIEPCTFQHPEIAIKKIIPKQKRAEENNLNGFKRLKSVATVESQSSSLRKNVVEEGSALSNMKREIKLDSLKASEIEAIIKGVFVPQEKNNRHVAVTITTDLHRDKVTNNLTAFKEHGSKRFAVQQGKGNNKESQVISKIASQKLKNVNVKKSESSPKLFPCFACSLQFVTYTRSLDHFKRSHQKGNKQCYCPKCHNTFANRNSLRKHMRRKHNMTPKITVPRS